MAEDTAVLALGIDSSGAEAGAGVYVRSANSIKSANDALGASVHQLTTEQSLIEGAYRGTVGASDMLADATRRATLATDAERVSFDTLVGPAHAAALAHQRLAEGAAVATAAVTAETEAVVANEVATGNAFGGTNRLIRSMDSLAFSAVGVRGPLSTITSSLGLMAGGSGVMMAVAAAAVILTEAYKLLTQDSANVTAASTGLVDGLKKQQEQEDKTARGALLAAQAEAQVVVTHAEALQAQGMVVGKMDLYRQALFAASINLQHFDAAERQSINTGRLTLEILQQRAAAHSLDAAGWAQLTDIRAKANATIADAETKERAAAAGSREMSAALKEEHDARAALATVNGLYTRSEHEVTKAERDAERARRAAAVAADKAARESAKVDAEVAAQKKLFAGEETKYADAAAIGARLEAQLAGDTKAAFDDKYTDQIQKIGEATAKTIAEIDANKDLIPIQKLLFDAIALAAGARQIANVEDQKAIDLKARVAHGAKTLAEAETSYQVAFLKSLGEVTAAQDLQRASHMALAIQVVRDSKTIDEADKPRIIALMQQTEALDSMATHTVHSTDLQAAAYKQLGRDIQHSLASAFDGVLTKGLSSFTTLVSEIEKLFTKLLADMAAQAIAKDVGGLLLSGGGSTTYKGVTAGLPWNQIGNAEAGAGGAAMAAGPMIFLSAIAFMVSSMFDQAAAAKKAAEALAGAEKSWAVTLQQYVDSISTGVSDLTKAKDSAVNGRLGVLNQAASTFGLSAANAFAIEALTPEQLAAFVDVLRHVSTMGGSFASNANAALAFIDAMAHVPSVLTVTADQVTKFTKSIQDTYTASLAGGSSQLTLQGFADARDKALKSASDNGVSGLTTTILQTYTNQVSNLLKGLNESDLKTLLPTLTGDFLALAQGMIAAQDATEATTLAVRLATVQGQANAGLLAKQASDATEYATAVKNGMSAANLATLAMVQGLEEAKIALQDVNTAARNLNQSAAFDASLAQRQAGLSGNTAALKAANLDALSAAQAAAYQAALEQYQQHLLTQAQLNRLAAVQLGEYNKALGTVDGTLTGVSSSVNKLAVAAQILSNNASQLTQQFSVFGTTLKDQADTLRKLYGFDGQSDATIRGRYAKEQNGVDLTPAQKALDDKIAAYFAVENQYLSSIATATTTTAAAATGAPSLSGAVTATYGNSMPVLMNPAFYITIEIPPEMAEQGSVIVQKIKDALVAEVSQQQFNRASLVKGMQGVP